MEITKYAEWMRKCAESARTSDPKLSEAERKKINAELKAEYLGLASLLDRVDNLRASATSGAAATLDKQELMNGICAVFGVEAPKVEYTDADLHLMMKRSFASQGMTFGMAIEAMKRGKKVARKGWNGKGMWLCVPLVDGPKEIPVSGLWGKPNAEYAEQNGGAAKVMPYVTMKAADGSIVMGWLASQTDMLADDWVIV